MREQRIIVLGSGISGKSVARFLYERGDYVIGVDSALEPLVSCEYFHERYLESSQEFPEDVSLLVRSPGIRMTHSWVVEAQHRGIPIYTDIQLAFQSQEFARFPSVGITGSNGKTTTTLFLTHLFKCAGIPAFAMGNIGFPVLDGMREEGVRVVEISSFQLQNVHSYSPVLSGGIILNLSENHLDYHGTMDDYTAAKYKLAQYVRDGKNLWGGEGVSIGNSYLPKVHELFSLVNTQCADLFLYTHDICNYCAAYVLANEVVSIDKEVFLSAIKLFKKPPHRIEYLGEKGLVHYINDSKATTVSSIEKALLALGKHVVLILGGRNKGSNFSSLIPVLTKTAKYIIAMGECRGQIAQDLLGLFPISLAKDLQEAVEIARCVATPGDSVLFSPGCASFDQFKNFEERGNCFKQLVQEMEQS